MKQKLIEYCNSINIDNVGIAPAEPYLDFGEMWKLQLEKGHISGFEEKDAERRIYPSQTLEDARSVIVCLFPYYTGQMENANLCKSAYSVDYHIIAKNKLLAISRFLSETLKGFKYKAFVDNGPFSDRYLAYKAGLGFWGVNNHIITDKYGSYVFIGYILNNYPFEADSPQDRTCLQCFECMKRCPGRCILGDFTINPQRCKSFITQKKSELSTQDRDILKKHELIWGCDVCQDVCPHNKHIEKTKMIEFKENLIGRLEYEELAHISNREFLRKYSDRAFSWRGKAVLRRNYEIINNITK
jgi:epoxyqueuosine reductase